MLLRDWKWFDLVQKTKPMIGMRDVEGELNALEENLKIKEEKKALAKHLESEQGNISQYTDRQSQITEDKAQLEIDLQDAAKRLIVAEQERQDATAEKKNLEAETSLIKKDI